MSQPTASAAPAGSVRFAPGRHGAADYGGDLVVDCDVAVIGAGAGGCAAAAALAEHGVRVAVFEEGTHWRPSESQRITTRSESVPIEPGEV